MICVLGVFTAIMPFCTSIWQLYLSSFISLVGGGAFDVGVVPWIIEIWRQHSAPLLQLLKASQGLGVIFGPLLDEPFLMGELQVNNITLYNQNETFIEMATEELNYSIDRRSNLQIPFLVTGCVAIPGKSLLVQQWLTLILLFVQQFLSSWSSYILSRNTRHQKTDSRTNWCAIEQIRQLLCSHARSSTFWSHYCP